MAPDFGTDETDESQYGRIWREQKYFLPTDIQEADRLDMQHVIFKTLFGDKLALAPIGENPKHVLDMATGTGIWAVEFAQDHPSTNVVGADLTSDQFSEQGKPKNCTFIEEDMDEPWNHTHQFDYIHGRALVGCIADHRALTKRAFDNLVPGGYFELQDLVFPFCFAKPPPEGSSYARWNELIAEANKILPRKYDEVVNYAKYMREAGFVDVHEQKFFLPAGDWTGEERYAKLGSWQRLNLMNVFEGATMKNMQLLGMPIDEIDELVGGNQTRALYGWGALILGRCGCVWTEAFVRFLF